MSVEIELVTREEFSTAAADVRRGRIRLDIVFEIKKRLIKGQED